MFKVGDKVRLRPMFQEGVIGAGTEARLGSNKDYTISIVSEQTRFGIPCFVCLVETGDVLWVGDIFDKTDPSMITLPEWGLILSALRYASITSGQMSRYEQAEAYQSLMRKVRKIMGSEEKE